MFIIILTFILGFLLLYVQIYYPWIRFDISHLFTLFHMKRKITKLKKQELVVDWLEKQAREDPTRTFIIYKNKNYSYGFVDGKANQVARVGLKLGLKAADVVSMMMQNEPAFLWTYFGLQKIGVSVSIINYHVRKESLLHCIKSCKPQCLIAGEGSEAVNALQEIRDDVPDIRMFVHGETQAGFESLSRRMDRETTNPVQRKHRAGVEERDTAAFIFTSGTTGLPKPAVITHRRTKIGHALFSSFSFRRDDVLYETLPLYHSSALNAGISAVIKAGAKVVLKSKFSVKEFWGDCRNHHVTVIHYIGEMCRYLVDTPRSENDGIHNIRVAVGSGLRKDIWELFTTRFKIPRVVEFYSATESVTAFINTSNRLGAVGRSSPLTRFLVPSLFVKFDHMTQSAVRDRNGRCIPVGKDQVGLLLSKLKTRTQFDGYYGRVEETDRKLLTDVMETGDVYFNTGDLFFIDRDYFVNFQDRTGDTFRWKGENVSASEVTNVLCSINNIYDVNVYGVTVPGCEGRAGMAAIQLKTDVIFDNKLLEEIFNKCSAQLPFYARPKFLRFQRHLAVSSTFKMPKMQLVEEGFQPGRVIDPLFYLDKQSNGYKTITQSVYDGIVENRIKL